MTGFVESNRSLSVMNQIEICFFIFHNHNTKDLKIAYFDYRDQIYVYILKCMSIVKGI